MFLHKVGDEIPMAVNLFTTNAEMQHQANIKTTNVTFLEYAKPHQ